jgi:myo-inositol-1(or 4)-monophosphatase
MTKEEKEITMTVEAKRDRLVKHWIREAAEDIKEALLTELDVEEKSARNDLVTNMDKKIEEDLTKKIREHFPEDRILGEEGFGDELDNLEGTVWLIDPIDGTLNFVLQQDKFAIMIGIYEDGVGKQGYIYDFTHDKLYYAIKGEGAYCNDQRMESIEELSLEEGLFASSSLLLTEKDRETNRRIADRCMGVRMLGSAGLEAMEVAQGNCVAYMATVLKPWDIAAGKVIVEELGGKVTRFDGTPINLLEKNRTIFANKKAHQEIVAELTK